jgi:hypothetical protein
MSLVIAFAGPAGHGKTTCARFAEEYLVSKGLKVKVISFADRLKEACKIIFRLTDKDVNNHIAKSTLRTHLGTTPRVIMQKFGTEVCRDGIKVHLPYIGSEHDETIWTWNVEQDILSLKSDDTVAIIQDLRFTDEKEMLQRYNAVIINIVRPGYSPIESSSHTSEKGLTGDYTVNNHTLDKLREDIEKIINQALN